MHIYFFPVFYDDLCQPIIIEFVEQKLGAVFQLLALLVGNFLNL